MEKNFFQKRRTKKNSFIKTLHKKTISVNGLKQNPFR